MDSAFERRFSEARARHEQAKREMDDLPVVAKMREHIRLAEFAIKVAESEASWKAKYDIVFSPDVSSLLPKLDYWDPDTTEEEDVGAYIAALREELEEWRAVIKAVDGAQDDNR